MTSNYNLNIGCRDAEILLNALNLAYGYIVDSSVIDKRVVQETCDIINYLDSITIKEENSSKIVGFKNK